MERHGCGCTRGFWATGPAGTGAVQDYHTHGRVLRGYLAGGRHMYSRLIGVGICILDVFYTMIVNQFNENQRLTL